MQSALDPGAATVQPAFDPVAPPIEATVEPVAPPVEPPGQAGTAGLVGAIGAHLGPLGIEVAGDGGTLFVLALITLVAGATVATLRRSELPIIGGRLACCTAPTHS